MISWLTTVFGNFWAMLFRHWAWDAEISGLIKVCTKYVFLCSVSLMFFVWREDDFTNLGQQLWLSFLTVVKKSPNHDNFEDSTKTVAEDTKQMCSYFPCDHLYGLIFWLARGYGFVIQVGAKPTKVRDRLLHCTQSWICTPSSWEVQRWDFRILGFWSFS